MRGCETWCTARGGTSRPTGGRARGAGPRCPRRATRPDRVFLILHGLANHRPPGHWQRWLAERLRSHGEAVVYPALPDPDRPRLALWEGALREHLAAVAGRERIVICHSSPACCGCAPAPRRPARRAWPGFCSSRRRRPSGSPRRAPSFAWTGSTAPPCGGRGGPGPDRASDADPYGPPGTAEGYAEALGAEARRPSGGRPHHARGRLRPLAVRPPSGA